MDSNLSDRMKEFYENRSKTYLTRRMPVIIRIDGSHFHSFCRGLKKPFDKIFIRTMQKTTQALCESIQGCKLGYVESDEISLLLTDYDTLQTDAWFDYSVQKVCSVSASMTAMYFNRFFAEEVNAFKEKMSDSKEDADYYEKLTCKIKLGGYFDARAFNIPESEIVNYFIWRQNDATRNSISGLAQSKFSQKQLNSKSCNEMQDMLHETFNINWNDLDIVSKRGSCIIKKVFEEKIKANGGEMVAIRNKWVIDNKIPIFTQDRAYIESALPKAD